MKVRQVGVSEAINLRAMFTRGSSEAEHLRISLVVLGGHGECVGWW